MSSSKSSMLTQRCQTLRKSRHSTRRWQNGQKTSQRLHCLTVLSIFCVNLQSLQSRQNSTSDKHLPMNKVKAQEKSCALCFLLLSSLAYSATGAAGTAAGSSFWIVRSWMNWSSEFTPFLPSTPPRFMIEGSFTPASALPRFSHLYCAITFWRSSSACCSSVMAPDFLFAFACYSGIKAFWNIFWTNKYILNAICKMFSAICISTSYLLFLFRQ